MPTDSAHSDEGTASQVSAATSGGRFLRPKSLYIEAGGIREDDTEFVVKMRLEAATTNDSHLTLDMENLAIEDGSNGPYVRPVPTGEHNVRIEFTRCRLGDADAQPSGSDVRPEATND